ncbi:hypothetical protein B0J18DRAFT_208751 [Chaetomium sp. MPI-SDFR-AT-0129]|nr:hypothetical protein B0J18DRAFT_208751 [Chaetomium sp. MPI-SDFR-AT-0129]
MKFTALVALCATAVQATDYFFTYDGGNQITNGQRLRGNNSIDYYSPGVTLPPYNSEDHFQRISTNLTTCAGPQNPGTLQVVPTHPHPPPVPGYYALSDKEKVGDAYRLVYTYHADDAAESVKYKSWKLHTVGNGSRKDLASLSFEGEGLNSGDWTWVARKEVSGGFEKWVPWYVKTSRFPSILTEWELVKVDLRLITAKGPVNSNAPGGVQE